MQLTDITGISGVALALVWLALRLLNRNKSAISPPFALSLSKARSWFDQLTTNGFKRFSLGLFVLLAMLIPWGGVSLAEFVRGISGDLSISTVLLILVQQFAGKPLNLRPFFGLIALASLALYPFALGLTLFDSYRIGFGNYLFLLTILTITLLALWKNQKLIASVLSLAVLAWSVGYYESSNVWDYLLDPWLTIVAWVTLLRKRS